MAKVKSPEDFIRGDVKLSSLPTVYTKINESVTNPYCPVAEIGKIIAEDLGLTSRILQLVNSAFFGFPSKIDTVSSACVIIGARQLRDLALATSVMSMFKSIPPELVDMKSFWQHSIACGMVAGMLGAKSGKTTEERFFVSGILHDIGRLVLYQKAPELMLQIIAKARKEETTLYYQEKRRLGFTHADIGEALFSKWKLPQALKEPVVNHHTPTISENFPVETSIVHIADVITHAMQWGNNGEIFVPQCDNTAWEILELKPEDITILVDQISDQIGEMVNTMIND